MNYDELLHQSVAGFPGTPNLMDYNTRRRASERLAECTNRFSFDSKTESVVKEIEREGIVDMGPCLDTPQITEIRNYLANKDVYNGHVIADSDGTARKLTPDYPHRYAVYSAQDVVNAPHMLDLALSEEFVDIAKGYLGCVPTIFSMNCWWTMPTPADSYTGIENFHRDWDDYKFLALFVYLTDVNDDTGGSHCFVKKFHRPEALSGLPVADQFDKHHPVSWYENNCPDLINYFNAPAGNGFCADTFSLHRGTRCKKPRLALWIRYGHFSNTVFREDKGRELNLFKQSYENRLATLSGFRLRRLTDRQKYMIRLLAKTNG